MKQATTKGVFHYWNEVRNGRVAPRRFEIEPSQITHVLAETLILETPLAGECRVRLAGTRLCEWFGSELRDTQFFAHWNAQDRAVLRDNIGTITEYGAVGHFTFEAKSNDLAETADFEMLVLPLLHANERIERLLGSITPYHVPSWLGEVMPARLALTSNQLIWPDGRPRARPHAEQIRKDGSPLDVSTFRGTEDGPIRRARLVRTDRRSFLVYDGGLANTDD